MNFRFNTDSWFVFSIFFLFFLGVFVFAFIVIPYLKRKQIKDRWTNRKRKMNDLQEKLDKKSFTQQIIQLELNNNKLAIDLKSRLITIVKVSPSHEDLIEFFTAFDQIYPSFVSTLQRMIHEVSSTEIRLCVLLRLGLNSKEIAVTLNITQESVNKARYRLRKKMELKSGDDLYSFLLSL